MLVERLMQEHCRLSSQMWTLGGEFSCHSFGSMSFFSNNIPLEFRGIQLPLTGGS